jgi:hypothetical protein
LFIDCWWEKGDKAAKRLPGTFLLSYLQARIAKLQQEKEEILKELEDKKLAKEEDNQIMQQMHEK